MEEKTTAATGIFLGSHSFFSEESDFRLRDKTVTLSTTPSGRVQMAASMSSACWDTSSLLCLPPSSLTLLHSASRGDSQTTHLHLCVNLSHNYPLIGVFKPSFLSSSGHVQTIKTISDSHEWIRTKSLWSRKPYLFAIKIRFLAFLPRWKWVLLRYKWQFLSLLVTWHHCLLRLPFPTLMEGNYSTCCRDTVTYAPHLPLVGMVPFNSSPSNYGSFGGCSSD